MYLGSLGPTDQQVNERSPILGTGIVIWQPAVSETRIAPESQYLVILYILVYVYSFKEPSIEVDFYMAL